MIDSGPGDPGELDHGRAGRALGVLGRPDPDPGKVVLQHAGRAEHRSNAHHGLDKQHGPQHHANVANTKATRIGRPLGARTPGVVTLDARRIDWPLAPYELVKTITGDGYTAYVLDMTSQTWRSTSEVDRTILFLSRFPVQSVESVRHSPTSVLEINQTDTATNQQARVTVTQLPVIEVAAMDRRATAKAARESIAAVLGR